MPAKNAVIVIAVVALVAGVAWFRTMRVPTTAVPPTTSAPAGATESDSPPGPATQAAAQTGDATRSATSAPTTSTANPAATKKLPRVVDLGADKCIPCKKLAPILEELKKEYAGRVTVEFIDVWKNPDAGTPYKIKLIPTQIFFDADGKEVWRHEGFLPKADFLAKFAELGVQ